jgi:adenine-specific DNA-methyltransferase
MLAPRQDLLYHTARAMSQITVHKPVHLPDRHTASTPETAGHGPDKRRELGQILTPPAVADFLASLFEVPEDDVELLDAGAGAGALTAALVGRLCVASRKPKRIAVTAYELDVSLLDDLRTTLTDCGRRCRQSGIAFSATVRNEDFVAAATGMLQESLFRSEAAQFNKAIVNPPYRKIASDSAARRHLRGVGIETSNLYSGFVSLIVRLLRVGGELVAITPRSFCNGPYFKPFRRDFLESMSLRRLHVFESRSAAFGRDRVLQENLIVHAVKGRGRPDAVTVSTSSGAPNSPVVQHSVSYQDVVSPDDADGIIHLAVSSAQSRARATLSRLTTGLADLGLEVSTGRVVDFRAREFLRQEPEEGTAPLIYPCHFSGAYVRWPKAGSRKPNAILVDKNTQELLVPAGVYVLVKRFSAKEERRRLVACIYDSDRIVAPQVGFENHLNYFHCRGQGLPKTLARGLAVFLNSTLVDEHFRAFSGHTQVNAADLRRLGYPAKSALERLGEKFQSEALDQSAIDELVVSNGEEWAGSAGGRAPPQTERSDGDTRGYRLRPEAAQRDRRLHAVGAAGPVARSAVVKGCCSAARHNPYH